MASDGAPTDLERVLAPDEELLWHESSDRWDPLGRLLGRDPSSLTLRVLVTVLLAAAAGSLAVSILSDLGAVLYFVLFLIVILVAPVVGLVLVAERSRSNLEYAATDRRVLKCSGLVATTCEDVAWSDVEKVEMQYNQHGVPVELAVHERGSSDSLLSYGRGDLDFRNVSDPNAAYRRLQSIRSKHADTTDGSAVETASRSAVASDIRDELDPDEEVVYRTAPESEYRTKIRRGVPIAAGGLGVLAAGGVGGYFATTRGIVPVVPPLTAGITVGAVGGYLLYHWERRRYERSGVVVTDRRIVTSDADGVESILWSETDGVEVEGENLVVLTDATGMAAIGARSKQPGVEIHAGDDPTALYERLQSIYEEDGT